MKHNFFRILLALTFLALPWQTRWFADATLAGWPWEQGRWSVYASWILMIAVIALGAWIRRIQLSRNARLFLVVLALLIAETVVPHVGSPLALRAIAQWWIEVLLLAGFVWTLVRFNVSSRFLCAWFSLSLVVPALLGLWQFASQFAFASTWLGLAQHDPATLGTAVVEAGGRFLRAYGSFPHPNIFGDWLALGVLAATAWRFFAKTLPERIASTATLALVSFALPFSLSRSALIGVACGMVALIVSVLVRRKKPSAHVAPFAARNIPLMPVLLAFVGATAAAIFILHPLLFARADVQGRLEAKSIAVRVGSWQDGVAIFRAHPFFGTGPNAELLSLAPSRGNAPAPLEPPHDAFLVALDDLGLVGMFLLGALLFMIIKPRNTIYDLRPTIYLIPVFVWALVDHGPWTTWSGLVLVALSLLLGSVASHPFDGS